MKQTHIIRIETQGSNGKLMVNIISDYYGQRIPIPIQNKPGDLTPAINTAIDYLTQTGQKVISYCVGKTGVHYLVLEGFTPLNQ